MDTHLGKQANRHPTIIGLALRSECVNGEETLKNELGS
jgi:hypothetical protein